MAWFITQRLTDAGWTCSGVYGRNSIAVQGVASNFKLSIYSALSEVPDDVQHICILAVSDTAIGELTSELQFRETTLVHTSGTSSIGLLSGAAHNCAVLWPVYSILKDSFPVHRNIPIAWQASTACAQENVLNIAKAISDIIFEAGEQQRRQLHLAAVFANNFTNHLMAVAEQICLEQDISFEHLKPILQQTFERSANASPQLLQTGPARRNDTITIDKHLEMLNSHPHWQALYKSLSMSIKKMYEPGSE